VARTSTFALNNATIGHALAIADKGWKRAAVDDPHLRAGLNVVHGQVTHEAVAHSLGCAYVDAASLLA
jgi:alanine dehydrogenase